MLALDTIKKRRKIVRGHKANPACLDGVCFIAKKPSERDNFLRAYLLNLRILETNPASARQFHHHWAGFIFVIDDNDDSYLIVQFFMIDNFHFIITVEDGEGGVFRRG